MAYGEFKVSGDEVYEALTDCSARTGYVRQLNEDGEKLAELLAAKVITLIAAKLYKKESEVEV